MQRLDRSDMAGGGGSLTFRVMLLDEAIRHGTEQLYHPHGGEGRSTADGIRLLRAAALDTPVYLVRLEVGYVQRTLQQVTSDLISEKRLVEGGVTGYAAAFQRGEQRMLIVVSCAHLHRPMKAEMVMESR